MKDKQTNPCNPCDPCDPCDQQIPFCPSPANEQFYLAMTQMANTASAERLCMQNEMDKFCLMLSQLNCSKNIVPNKNYHKTHDNNDCNKTVKNVST